LSAFQHLCSSQAPRNQQEHEATPLYISSIPTVTYSMTSRLTHLTAQ